MRALLQICSYVFLILSRRIKKRKKNLLIKVRTDLQQFSRNICDAVLTVEAAIVLPLFLFAVLSFCYLFQIMEFQIKLQAALNQTAEQAASYGYLLGRVTAVTEQKAEAILEKTGLFSEDGLISLDDAGAWAVRLLGFAPAELALKQMTEKNMEPDGNRNLRLVNGWDGVSFKGSCIRDEERCVVVVAEYSIRIPFVPELLSELALRQSAICHLHCGDRDYVPKQKPDESGDAEETEYYVTASGTVYHRSRECRYLNVSVLSVKTSLLDGLRNNSGGKYYPCTFCVHGKEVSDTVFYTRAGSSYHASRNCSSLTRTVLVKSEEEIAGLPPCSVCGQEKE